MKLIIDTRSLEIFENKKVSGYVKTFRMDMFLEETIKNDYDPIYNDP